VLNSFKERSSGTEIDVNGERSHPLVGRQIQNIRKILGRRGRVAFEVTLTGSSNQVRSVAIRIELREPSRAPCPHQCGHLSLRSNSARPPKMVSIRGRGASSSITSDLGCPTGRKYPKVFPTISDDFRPFPTVSDQTATLFLRRRQLTSCGRLRSLARGQEPQYL
jgi:hypothetical protein